MIWKTIVILLETFASFIIILGISFIFCRFIVGHFFRFLSTCSKELHLLGTLCVMFVMLLITQWLGISMELGCFLGGFILASSTTKGTTRRKGTASFVSLHRLFKSSFKLKRESLGQSSVLIIGHIS